MVCEMAVSAKENKWVGRRNWTEEMVREGSCSGVRERVYWSCGVDGMRGRMEVAYLFNVVRL